MAEDDQNKELSDSETEELEKLLSDSEGEETAEGAEASVEEAPKGFVQRLKSDKKFLIMIVAVVLLLIASGGGAYWYLFMQAPPIEEQAKVEEKESAEPGEDEDVLPVGDIPYVYSLDPFFLALHENDNSSDRFIKVVAHLLLSNSALSDELEKVLPQIRFGIYKILRRTKPIDLIRNQAKIEEKIKSQIIIESNANLLSGTGTITDVFYTEFMIK